MNRTKEELVVIIKALCNGWENYLNCHGCPYFNHDTSSIDGTCDIVDVLEADG